MKWHRCGVYFKYNRKEKYSWEDVDETILANVDKFWSKEGLWRVMIISSMFLCLFENLLNKFLFFKERMVSLQQVSVLFYNYFSS